VPFAYLRVSRPAETNAYEARDQCLARTRMTVPDILSYAGERSSNARSITVHIGSMLVVYRGMSSALCLEPPAEQLPLLV
jgi:hypothetical protein